jgi:hypothetical protein
MSAIAKVVERNTQNAKKLKKKFTQNGKRNAMAKN